MARLKQRKKKKKVVWAFLLLLMSIIMVIASSLALFSDTTIIPFLGVAGTLELEAGEMEIKQYYTTMGVEQESIIEGDFIGNLNPGDMIEVSFPVTNNGSKSAYVRNTITFKVTGEKIPEDLLNNFYVIPYYEDDPALQRTIIREGILDTAVTFTLKEEESSQNVQVYEYIMDNAEIKVINGTVEIEEEDVGLNEVFSSYLLYFNSQAKNAYQGIHIECEIEVEAMQYRNNNQTEWQIVADEDISIGDKEIYYEYAKMKAEFNQYLNNISETPFIVADGANLATYIPNIKPAYVSKIAILKNELILLDSSDAAEALPLNYTLLTQEVYAYYKELREIEKEVAQIIATSGVQLGIDLDMYHTKSISGLIFSTGWTYLSKSDVENILGITVHNDRNSGFVVKYTTGEVLSIDGKLINNSYVYSLNYTGEGENQLYLSGLLTGVGKGSLTEPTKWGEFDILNGSATYDAKGGLILGTQLGEVAIDQTKPVNERYSINVTVKGALPQTNVETFPRAIAAISVESGKYLCWIGIRNKYLHIYSFSPDSARPNIDYEVNAPGMPSLPANNGFMSIDLTKYGFDFNNKYLNIQIVAERESLTKVYINGTLFHTFSSGNGNLGYGYMTVGDLRSRPVRNLRYEGVIYNLALYSELIPEEAIKQNWEYTKWQLDTP